MPYEKLSLNQRTLLMLRTAPDSQASPKVLEMLHGTDLNSPAAIVETFRAIYMLPESERSNFVAVAVNPMHTAKPEYSEPIDEPFLFHHTHHDKP